MLIEDSRSCTTLAQWPQRPSTNRNDEASKANHLPILQELEVHKRNRDTERGLDAEHVARPLVDPICEQPTVASGAKLILICACTSGVRGGGEKDRGGNQCEMNTVRLRLCLLVPVSKARSRQKLQQINAAVPKGTISPYFAMQPKSIDAETVDGPL